jgi:ribonuclease BN (tRNA processing enzyme)
MDGKLFFLALVVGILVLAWLGAGVLWRAAEMAEIVAPLDPYEFEDLSVVTLGTGNEYENPNRHGPSTAIGLGRTVVLVDAGRGIAEALRGAKIPLNQPSLIVLTNLLPLNTLGLDDLLLTGWLVPREEPLRILGPPGTRTLVESLERAHAAGRDALGTAISLPAQGGRFEVSEVTDGYTEEIGGFRIEARSLPGGPLPTLAWRFSDGAQRIVVSGSGWGRNVLASFAGGADVLVHEAAYLPTVEELEGTGAEVPFPERLELEAALHTSILEVGGIATEAQVDRLVLVRLRPPPFFDLQVRSLVANDYKGEIIVPKDGDFVFP